MLRLVIATAACGVVAACATAPAGTADAQRECVSQTEEATGSRVESVKVCSPGEPADGTQ